VETFGSEGAIFGLSDSFDRSVGKVGLGRHRSSVP